MRPCLLFITIFCFLNSKAQKITTTESEEKFHNGIRNAICTNIYRTDIKNILIEWLNYLKQFKHEAITVNRNEVYGHNLFLKNIINRPIDIYTYFELVKETQTIKMNCTIDVGAGNYLKSSVDTNEIKEEEKMVKDFAIKMTKAPYEALLKASNLKRDNLIKDNLSLDKEIKNANEDIVDYAKKLVKLQKDSSEKSAEVLKNYQELESQKKINDTITVKESAFALASKKTMEKLLNQKNDAEDDSKNLNTKIKALREKIYRSETDVKVNGEFIIKNKGEIENQKLIADDLKKKLAQIN